MDDALLERVVAELRRNGYDEWSDADLRQLAGTAIVQTTAMHLLMVDLTEEFTRATWPGRLLVRLADVSSRALARMVG